jgi:hypothetical protein
MWPWIVVACGVVVAGLVILRWEVMDIVLDRFVLLDRFGALADWMGGEVRWRVLVDSETGERTTSPAAL